MTVEVILTPEKSLFFENISFVRVESDNSRVILYRKDKNKKTPVACASFTIKNIVGYIYKKTIDKIQE